MITKLISLSMLLVLMSVAHAADINPGLPILQDGSKNAVVADACTIGTSPTSKNGIAAFSFLDASGNFILPQFGQAQATNSIPVVTQADAQPATQTITAQDISSATVTGANGQVFFLGTPTAGSVANFVLSSFAAIEVQVTGLWTGTLTTEVSTDGGTLWAPRGVKQTGSPYISTTFTQNFWGGMNFIGMTNVRVRSTAAWSGTAVVRVTASINAGSVIVTNPQMLRDGTTQSIFNTIKAASTAALATDTAIVVALSPNSPLPTGSNNVGSITNITGTVPLPTGAATSADQTNGTQKTQIVDGSANVMPVGDVAARGIFDKLTDGTNTATIKPASTAAVAADTALVVALSPNNTISTSSRTGITANSPTNVSVGVATTALVATNANRKGLIIMNLSTATVSLGIGVSAVLNSGITLYPGGIWTMDEYSFNTAAINAIAGTAASSVAYQEFQ